MKTVVLNSEKMNYDHKLDLSILSDNLVVYENTEQEEILTRVQNQEVVITKELPLSADMIQSFPDCVKLIVEAGTGYNNINMDACKKKGITVCNVPAYSTKRVAHTAITFVLNLSSSLHTQQRMLINKNRNNFTKCMEVNHVEVNGKTLGIIGYGNIGKEVVRIAEVLDMNILVYTRTKRENVRNIKFVDLETVLSQSDYVSLHCPLTDATKHIINEKTINMMKPSAFLINTSRGPLVDEPALIKALKENKISGAALDVQEIEPPLNDNPLYDMENVILTPHMGWKGLETRQRMIEITANDIKAYADGNPINVVS